MFKLKKPADRMRKNIRISRENRLHDKTLRIKSFRISVPTVNSGFI